MTDEAREKERIRNAALQSILAEVKAMLEVPQIEVNSKLFVPIPADRVPEIKRRIGSYVQAAMSGD